MKSKKRNIILGSISVLVLILITILNSPIFEGKIVTIEDEELGLIEITNPLFAPLKQTFIRESTAVVGEKITIGVEPLGIFRPTNVDFATLVINKDGTTIKQINMKSA